MKSFSSAFYALYKRIVDCINRIIPLIEVILYSFNFKVKTITIYIFSTLKRIESDGFYPLPATLMRVEGGGFPS